MSGLPFPRRLREDYILWIFAHFLDVRVFAQPLKVLLDFAHFFLKVHYAVATGAALR